jgi:hypothetical protein
VVGLGFVIVVEALLLLHFWCLGKFDW